MMSTDICNAKTCGILHVVHLHTKNKLYLQKLKQKTDADSDQNSR